MREKFADWASPRRIDIAVAVALAMSVLPQLRSWWQPDGGEASPGGWLGAVGLAVAQGLPFLWRRRIPLTLLVYCLALFAAHTGTGHAAVPAGTGVLVAAYGLGAYGAPRIRALARWSAAAALAGAVVSVLVLSRYSGHNPVLPLTLFAAAVMAGQMQADRQHALAAAAEEACDAERARIARELHDVLSHQLTAIALHATGTRIAAGGRPDDVPDPVEHLARAALAELDQLLGLLRREPGPGPDLGPGEVRVQPPAPGLDDLEQMLRQVRATGTPVALTVTGQRPELGEGLQVSAYRIVQEALTNVTKHAPGASTGITVHYGATDMRIEVANGPRTAPPAQPVSRQRPGRGLTGMRERAALRGGTLHAAPTGDGGFRVTATLPYRWVGDRGPA